MRLLPLLIPTTLFTNPVMADITADDVWANTTAFYRATGGNLVATLTREGNSVFVDDVSLFYTLPYDVGQVVFAMPPMTMIEQDDGSVAQKLPKSFDLGLRLKGDPFFFGDLAVSALITQADFVASVTGTTGNMSYSRSAEAFGATVDVRSDEFGLDMSFDFTGDGYEQTTRVEEGDLIRITSDQETDVMRYSYRSEEEYGYSSDGSGEYGASMGRLEAALPANGFDLMRPSLAIAEGMFIRVSSTQAGSRDETATYFEDEIMTRDSTIAGPTQSTVALSEDGLAMEFDVSDLSLNFEDRSFGAFLIDATIDHLHGRFSLPLMARETAQTLNLQTELAGLAVSDEVWDQFDPDSAISRAPANLKIDLTSDVVLGVDLLDFDNIEDAFYTPENLIAPESLSLNSFSLDAVGVEASGEGAFTFDNTDTITFDGLPRPEGQAEITVSGTNELLDRLIDIGLLDAGEAGIARMSLGMFTRPAGDSTLTATMLITPDGQVMVNGERLR